MKETSFGYKKEIHYLLDEKPKIELITFLKNGREHIHDVFETFVVLEGSGVIYSGEETVHVSAGDVVTIPPNTRLCPNYVLHGAPQRLMQTCFDIYAFSVTL
ncbi:cupin domain-containing protein, partial [Aeromonas veronii]|nr:cupin domain-containing protein [Aeromonas veronii]